LVGGTDAVHSLALKANGTVWAWGLNNVGQLGQGTSDDNPHPTPQQVGGVTDAIGLSSESGSCLVVRQNGTLLGWGCNVEGELGDGTTTQRNAPLPVSGLTLTLTMAGGFYHSLAVRHDGAVWAWGSNSNGQLGDGSTADNRTPVLISG